jgi:hypothetical protein
MIRNQPGKAERNRKTVRIIKRGIAPTPKVSAKLLLLVLGKKFHVPANSLIYGTALLLWKVGWGSRREGVHGRANHIQECPGVDAALVLSKLASTARQQPQLVQLRN